MPAIFVHLSDIHFGQERGSELVIHNDVKEQLIDDARQVVRNMESGNATGILVTGDIAHSGKKDQYKAAGQWLDRVAEAIGCEIHQIQMVPGNHDVERDKTSGAAKLMLEKIAAGGADELDEFLDNESDRELLFDRFREYGEFSEGYRCPLDTNGAYSSDSRVEIADGRAIRFIRINSALLCSGRETAENPELMLGARQFVFPRTSDEEVIVLSHHPLHWFKDSPEAMKYIQSRARVFISGHEHLPAVMVERVAPGCDLMMLAAGATVPPKPTDMYTYTYNILIFDWDHGSDSLAVTIYPRIWNPESTCFEAREGQLRGEGSRYCLASPKGGGSAGDAVSVTPEKGPVIRDLSKTEEHVETEPLETADDRGDTHVNADDYAIVLLRFFRELTEGERLKLLVELDAVSSLMKERLTHTIERRLLEQLIRQGRIGEIESRIAASLASRENGEIK
jgi:predicted phosphodiesterase